MVPHFWPQMTCILRILTFQETKTYHYFENNWKRFQGRSTGDACLCKQEPPLLALERKVTCLQSISSKATPIAFFLHYLIPLPFPFSSGPSSSASSSTCAGILMTSPGRQPSSVPEDSPSGNRTLKLTWLSRIRFLIWKNHLAFRASLCFESVSKLIFPKWSSHLWPQGANYTSVSRQRSPLLCERVQNPQKVKYSIHQLRPTWLNFSSSIKK